jgi:hypothetical protein
VTRLLVTWPDVERLVVDYLTELMADATVATTVPETWTDESDPHLQVTSDGSTAIVGPVMATLTVRLVARAGDPTTAKVLAARALGYLGAHPGSNERGGIASTTPLTLGPAARDPETRAELASATARVIVRSTEPTD